MISRFLLGLGLAVVMLIASFGTYVYLGARHTKISTAPQKPTAASPRPHAFALSGTLYLAQNGAIYSLNAGRFHQLTPEAGWTQPSLYPDGSYLLVVQRHQAFSDVYAISRFGTPEFQFTNNDAPARNPDTGARHWSFYPRLSLDEHILFMSYDEPKFGYDVPFSIWGIPFGAPISQGRLWTNSNDYTGGDMQPVPLQTGGIMYTKYSYGPDGNLVGQLWLTTRAYATGTALTPTNMDCAQPSQSPNGLAIAMICTYEKQASYLVIATWNGSYFGPFREVVTNQLVAQPIWAPDGSGIAYLAPAEPNGPFQLWFLPQEAYNAPPPSPTPVPTPTPGGPYNGTLPSPSPAAPVAPPVIKPIQITTNAGFDATSPLTWAD